MYYNNHLYHHGIKGMKWGVSRWKAKKIYRSDKKEAKKKYKDDLTKMDSKEAKQKYRADKKAAKRNYKSNMRTGRARVEGILQGTLITAGTVFAVSQVAPIVMKAGAKYAAGAAAKYVLDTWDKT